MAYRSTLGFCWLDVVALIILLIIIVVFVLRHHKMKKAIDEYEDIAASAMIKDDTIS